MGLYVRAYGRDARKSRFRREYVCRSERRRKIRATRRSGVSGGSARSGCRTHVFRGGPSRELAGDFISRTGNELATESPHGLSFHNDARGSASDYVRSSFDSVSSCVRHVIRPSINFSFDAPAF